MKLSDFFNGGVASAAYQLAYSNAVAADAMLQGDPLSMLADGTVTYAVPPSDPNAAIRPLTLAADAVNTAVKNVVVAPGGVSNGALLTSGNVAVPFTAPTSLFPQVAIYAPSGALVATVAVDAVAVSAAGAIQLAALTGGGFAVGYCTAAGFKYAIYDNTGAAVLAPTLLTANGTTALGIQALTNGGFAVLFVFVSAGFNVTTAAFNAAGAQQGATNVIETIAAAEVFNVGPATPSKLPPAMSQYGAANGYCVAYNYSSGVQTVFNVRLAFFNSSAVLQNALITHNNAGNANAQPKLLKLTDGTLVLAFSCVGTAGQNKVTKYSALGVQVVAPAVIDAGTIGAFALLATAAATFAILYNTTGSDLVQRTYSAAGAFVATLTYAAAFGAGPNNMDIKALSDGTYLVAAVSSVAATPRACRLDAALATALASAIVLDATNASTTSAVVGVFPVVNPATSAAVAVCLYVSTAGDGRFAAFVSLVKARTFIGVATAAAAPAASIRMQITGPAALSRTFAPALAVNYQANTIPGQKASLVGSTAILLGIQ